MKKLTFIVLSILTLTSCKKEEIVNCSQGVVVSTGYIEGYGFGPNSAITLKNSCSGNTKTFPGHWIEEFGNEWAYQYVADTIVNGDGDLQYGYTTAETPDFTNFCNSIEVGDTYTIREQTGTNMYEYVTW